MKGGAALLAVLLASGSADGQGGNRAHDGAPPQGFEFCRLQYHKARNEKDGNGWSTDYPQADRNLMIRFSELTNAPVAFQGDRFPDHRLVWGDSHALFMCPFIMASDVGTMSLTEAQAAGLRDYLLKGGFLWVDDFWGEAAWYYWLMEVQRILPGAVVFDLPLDHPVLAGPVPQVSHIGFWKQHDGETSERGGESAEVHVRGVNIGDRLAILMTHNTDVADTWERERDEEYFDAFAVDGYSIGVGVLLYAMTH